MDVESPAIVLMASAVATVVTQLGLAVRARYKMRNQTAQLSDLELAARDNRAFKFLEVELGKARDGHAACEARADQQQIKIDQMYREIDVSNWSIEILRQALITAGIPVPGLPKFERRAS